MSAATDADTALSSAGARSRSFADFAELVKARLTLLVLLTTAVGFYLGAAGEFAITALFHAVFGTALAAWGAAALNQWWERQLDALMHRTRERPLPAGRMSPRNALLLGALLSVAGVVYLAVTCNALSAWLAALTVVLYNFAYTPLKRISSMNTLVGAIPGAIPPVIGWAAARGEVGLGAWCLFAILFFWQMPHFFALAWKYRGDYDRAGFRMVSSGDDSGARSSSQSVLFCMALLIASGTPTHIRLTSHIYLGIATLLSALFLLAAMRFHQRRTAKDARNVFLASIIYLPLLLAALVLTKK
ncbi:MAG TPA: heme o synthase [Chthoniobacterales bacterium]